MDVLYFLRRRLRFTSNLYDQATAPFRETIRKIEAQEPPYVDPRNPEDDDLSEPFFLEEYQEAGESIEVIGHWCLCMVYASFKAFLAEYMSEIARDYQGLGDLKEKLAARKNKNWFERYRLLFLEDMGIDWRKGPVKLSELEHLNLARDDVTHNVDVMSMYVYQTDRHAERYPKGLFVDEVWLNLNLGGRIKVGRDELTAGLGMVDDFCAWLEDIRVHYRAYLKAREAPDKEA
jgi:hypothetical protein